jgi:large subunit ribosomal protein L4
VIDGASFDVPSTRRAVEVLQTWGKESPTLVVANEDEENLVKSFRNIERVLVIPVTELEVAGVVWARSLLVSQAALEAVQGRAQ